jgi:hypothetical protein
MIGRPIMVIQTPSEIELGQNDIKTAAAVTSAGIDMQLEYTVFHPIANARAGSKKYSACRT